MPMKATFEADFTTFNTAVDQATVKMKSFESGAARVEGQLNRMTDTFSGRKLIQDATLMTEAVERLGGASTLTEKELARVGNTAAAAAEKLRALGQDVPADMQKLADTVKTQGGFWDDLGQSIVTTAAGYATADAAMRAVSGTFSALTGFVESSVKAFADAELAHVRVTAALKGQSMAIPAVTSQYQALATQYQQTTVYQDDLIESMEGLLIQVGGIMPDTMDKALKASTDLAAGLGIDLQQATMLVAKAAAGHTETLGRYGVTVSKAAVDSQGFQAVLEAINRQFGGQAQAQVETYDGKIKQLANSWNNVQEAVGKYVAQNPLTQAAMNALTQQSKQLEDQTTDTASSFVGLAYDIGGAPLAALTAYLEKEADLYNLTASTKTLIDSIKPPALFQGGGPTDTAPKQQLIGEAERTGMQLYEQQLKATEAASKAFTKAQKEMDGVLVDYTKTIDEVDGNTVEAIRYYLALGVSVEALSGYYAVQIEQVQGIKKQQDDLNDTTKKLATLNANEYTPGLLGLSKAEQQTTQAEMERLKVVSALNIEQKKLADAAKAQVDATAARYAAGQTRYIGGGGAAPAGPDPVVAALDKYDADLKALLARYEAQIEKAPADMKDALRTSLEQEKILLQQGLDDAIVKAQSKQPAPSYQTSINVSGILDPRTIDELAAAIGAAQMRASGRQWPAA